MRLPFQTYELDSPAASSSRLVNCYIEQLPADAKTPAKLVRAPGVRSWGFSYGTVDHVRGLHEAFGYLWATVADVLYAIDKTGKAVQANGGSGFTEDYPSSVASTTDHVCWVTQPNATVFTINTTTGLTITSAHLNALDDDFGDRGASQVVFLDNYLLFREPNSGRFFSSDLANPYSYDALFFATAESSPDELVGMHVDHGQLFLLGAKTCEVWQNTGRSGFPFEAAINGQIDIGCIAGETAKTSNQTINFLADDLTVRKLQGITPVRISTHAIEQKIRKGDPSTATASVFVYEGHLFYVLHLSNATVVYDETTGVWHERQTYGHDTWQFQYHTAAFGKTIAGHIGRGSLGEIDPTWFGDLLEPAVMSWTYQPVYAEGRRAFHDRLEIIMETGVGVSEEDAETQANFGTGVDPVVMLEYSDDGGKTFDHLPDKSIGETGEYTDRVIWTGLGSAQQRVYRASVSDPVSVTVTDTILSVRGGRL